MKKILYSFVIVAVFNLMSCGIKLQPKSDLEDLRPSIPYKSKTTKAKETEKAGKKNERSENK